MYKLEFSDQRDFTGSREPLSYLSLYSVNGTTYVRQGGTLKSYRLRTSGRWSPAWSLDDFPSGDPVRYPWTALDGILSNRTLVVVKGPRGVSFYESGRESGVELLKTDELFDDAFWPALHLGRFYPEPGYLGVLARLPGSRAAFFTTTTDSLSPGDSDPLLPLDVDLRLGPEWASSSSEFLVVDLLRTNQDLIGIRCDYEMAFFRFDDDYNLKKILRTPLLRKTPNDLVLFPDLTKGRYKDALQLNSSGLFVYSYSDSKGSYEFVSRDDSFIDVPTLYRETFTVFDMDGDLRDDLVFTGPEGLTALSFDTKDKKWNTILNPESVEVGLRYSKLLGSIGTQSVLAQAPNGEVRWARVIEEKLPPIPPPEPTPTTPPPPEPKICRLGPSAPPPARLKEKPVLRWMEQFEKNFVKDALSVSGGEVSFSVPLVDSVATTGWGVKLDLTYGKDSRARLVGENWSVPLAQDYIAVDKRSVFPGDWTYYLVIQGKVLRLDAKASTDNSKHFRLAGEPYQKYRIDIEYLEKERKWVLEDSTERTVFGEQIGSLQWSLHWKNWSAPGTDESSLEPEIVAWYLSSREFKNSDQKLYYSYEVEETPFFGKKYTSAVRLKSITDGREMKLELGYGRKESSEYTTPNPRSNRGQALFPVPLTESVYLQYYEITTASFTQQVDLRYELKDGKRLLTSLEQNGERLLKFCYESHSGETYMSSLELPQLGLKAGFGYQPQQVPAYSLQFPVSQEPKFAKGHNYTLLGYKHNKDEVALKLFSPDFTRVLQDCLVDLDLDCPKGGSEIKEIDLVPFRDSFVIHSRMENQQAIYMYNRSGGKWSKNPTVRLFGKEAQFFFTTKNFVVLEGGRIFQFGFKDATWTESSRSAGDLVSLKVSGDFALVYANDVLKLLYADSGVWKEKSLANLSGRGPRAFVDKFDINQDIKDKVYNGLKRYALQAAGNVVLHNSIEEDRGQLYDALRLFNLGPDLDVADSQLVRIKRENLNDIQKVVSNKENTLHIGIGYVKRGNVYKIEAKKLWGESADRATQSQKEEKLKEINADKKFQENMKKQLWLDFSYYLNQLANNEVYCNTTVIRFSGSKWEPGEIPKKQRINLGKEFEMDHSKDRKSWVLYRKSDGSKIKEFKLYSADKIVHAYPSYIASQPEADSVEVLTFESEDVPGRSFKLMKESLVMSSDGRNLLTLANVTGGQEPMELRVRPGQSLFARDAFLVSRTELAEKGLSGRVTGYQRRTSVAKSPFGVTQVVREVPGGASGSHGYRELTLIASGGNATREEKWFDSEGREVPTPDKVKRKDEDSSADDNPSHLLDRSGRWLISDLSPYTVHDQMATFYGFEDYESGHIAPNNSWVLKNVHQVREEFSFTGLNYLQLSDVNASYVEGTLAPKDQEIAYVASCWIRSNQKLKLNTSSQLLKAFVIVKDQQVMGMQSEVKNHQDGWTYLELMLDFVFLRRKYKEFIGHSQQKSWPKNPKFSITLRVEPPSNGTMHLDHIRFFPLTHDYPVNVYKGHTGKRTAVIHASGMVTRHIFDSLMDKIGTINEKGQVTEFVIRSRSGLLPGFSRKEQSVVTFRPQGGFLESFDPTTLCNRWLVNSPGAWEFGRGRLRHDSSGKDIVFAGSSFSHVSAFSCYFFLQENQSSLAFRWEGVGILNLKRHSNSTIMNTPQGLTVGNLPTAGRVVTLLDMNHAWIWFDGVLLFDDTLKTGTNDHGTRFSLEVKGKVLLEDVVVMTNPSVKVEYLNSFGEKTQTIELEDATTALVSEVLYDELGRGAIITKTTRIVSSEGLLGYRPNFVTNKDPGDEGSVWRTGKIRGEIDTLNPRDEGFAYSRTTFHPNPLNEKNAVGLPGEEFAVTGRYSYKFSSESGIDFISNLFPESSGFRQKVQKIPNGTIKVYVLDGKGKQVATYTRVPGHDHALSTYEYDSKGRLVKILPPSYHERVDTKKRTAPWVPGDEHLSEEEHRLQRVLGTHMAFDPHGNLIKKTNPDTNTIEYDYNRSGKLQLLTFIGPEANHTVYMDYDLRGQLWRTGHRNLTTDSPQHFQLFYYSYDHEDPFLRGRMKQCVTQSGGETVVDKLYYGSDDRILNKETLASFHKEDGSSFKGFKRTFKGDKLIVLSYPLKFNGELLQIVHTYNRLGQLVGLGTHRDPYFYTKITYHASGQPSQVRYVSDGFAREYVYDSPGFLVRISDPFLTEEIAYTERGYGQSGFGDGSVMYAAYNATWSSTADERWFQIRDSDLQIDFAEVCLKALKRHGYVSTNGEPQKMYIPSSEIRMPLVCGGKSAARLSALLAEKIKPSHYGHFLAYGTHQELTKAKHFTDDTKPLVAPLQWDSFAKEIELLDDEQSRDIWNALKDAGFVIVDQKYDDHESAIGKKGKSLLRDSELLQDLKSLDNDFILYFEPIGKLLTSGIIKRQKLSLKEFEETFILWEAADETTTVDYERKKQNAGKIGSMLQQKGYLVDPNRILNDLFTRIMQKYSDLMPEVVGVLTRHFAHALGESAFDLESYNIDANGNHRMFYTGRDRYELSYEDSTNRLRSVRKSGEKAHFKVRHDHVGNVVKASHKGIKRIEYHPVSQRTSRIVLEDGSSLDFYYDANGGRVLKRVSDKEGNLTGETHYLRDERGRVLMDKVIDFRGGRSAVTTAYVYGPKGLLGFVRNGKFFTVTVDHTRSVRVVAHKGQVVAAYDYLPYGRSARAFGQDREGHIRYRFDGQELDEETGLYDFHARLYDPDIGRFYQPDPKMQYFSPYKFAGNSPVSVEDPDGEFAFFIIFVIIGALVGGYLGGAAANHSFNPLNWNWKSSDTWLGILKGGIEGAMMPLGFEVSPLLIAGELVLNMGSTYVSLAAANGSWNPKDWNWKDPATYLSLYETLDLSSGLGGALGEMGKLVKIMRTFTKKEKLFASLLTAAFTIGDIYKEEVEANGGEFAPWKWDWSNPDTIDALLHGLEDGISRDLKDMKTLKRKGLKGLAKRSVKRITHDLMGCVQDDGSEFTLFNTYQSFIGGLISERGELMKELRYMSRKRRHASLQVFPNLKNITNYVPEEMFFIEGSSDNKVSETASDLGSPAEVGESTTSGGSKRDLWGANIIKAAWTLVPVGLETAWRGIRGVLTSGGTEFVPSESVRRGGTGKDGSRPLLDTADREKPQIPLSNTCLQLGDQFVKNADMNGLLAWGVVLARKLTGYRPKPLNTGHCRETGVWAWITANTLVEGFMDHLEMSFEACGIDTKLLEDIIGVKDLQDLVRKVKRMISMGEVDGALEFLYNDLTRMKIQKIDEGDIGAKTERIKMLMRNHIPVWKAWLAKEENLRMSKELPTPATGDEINSTPQLQKETEGWIAGMQPQKSLIQFGLGKNVVY